MRITPLLFYIQSKYKKETIDKRRETYSTDLLAAILNNLRRDNKNKIKTWSEIEDKHFNKKTKDNRTAKEIEEEVLSKFKNWAG